MDSAQLSKIISQIGQLNYKFLGCFPADMVPKIIPRNKFCIVNSDKSTSSGTHWLMLANLNDNLYFGDSLGNRISTYKNIRISQRVLQMNHQTLQQSDLCGLYCIYFAYILYCGIENIVVNDYIIMRFFACYL